jgi:hypothetical protein
MTHPITEEEVGAYKLFSKECAKVEKGLYGTTVFQDSKVKHLLGDAKSEWAKTFEWVLTLKRIFDNEGDQNFSTKIAPDLIEKLLEIEKKTETFLTLARALLNGLGWGTVPVPSTAPVLDATYPPGPTVPERLAVVPPVAPPASD